LYIDSIKTFGFRNLENLEFSPNSNINIFIGKNGQGKTNLLETIYVASKGKSFRPGKIQEWRNQKFDSNSCKLEFRLRDGKQSHLLKIIWSDNSKQIFLDDKKVTSGKLLQLFPTILFSPESLLSVKEGPDKRRNLLDEMLTSSVETQHFYTQYKKSLKNRNKFLRNSKESGVFNEALYKSLNILFLNFSTQLTMARIDLLYKLNPHIKKALTLIFGNELKYEFEYIISERHIKNWSAAEILEFHQQRASDLRNAELSYGASLVGAHKHDLKFILNGKDARFFSSQGQQRGLILAIKMAEVMYRFNQGEKPVLLLDDVLSELDLEKREKLIEFLSTFQTQIFITTTDSIDGVELKGDYFKIKQGHIKLNERSTF
jgi:DNA replication and repair protein RecF